VGDTTTYYIAVEAYNTSGLHSAPSSEVIVKVPKGQLAIDTPKNNAVVTAPFNVTGWAVDSGAIFGTGVDVVQVWAYPNPGSGAAPVFVGSGVYGSSRTDVAKTYGSQFTASGYSVTVTNLSPAPYQLMVFAHSSVTGTFSSTSTKVTVAKGPILQVDTPLDNTAVWPTFAVAGWSVDLRSTSGTGIDKVNVYATKVGTSTQVLLGAATYGGTRADVGGAFGSRFAPSAFGLTVTLAPGVYDISTYAHSTVTNSFNNVKTTRVVVGPVMALDTPAKNQTVTSAATAQGWSVDLRASSGTGVDAVHVYAYPTNGGSPVFVGVAEYGLARADVANLFGAQFQNCAWRVPLSTVPRGSYNLIAYGHSTVSGQFDAVQTVKINVQ
jgi:hypothetical protein